MKFYDVYVLKNKKTKKTYVDMTDQICEPIKLNNAMLRDILDGKCKANDFQMYVVGQHLRYSKALDLKIKNMIKLGSYIEETGYNDINAGIDVRFVPKTITYGEVDL